MLQRIAPLALFLTAALPPPAALAQAAVEADAVAEHVIALAGAVGEGGGVRAARFACSDGYFEERERAAMERREFGTGVG